MDEAKKFKKTIIISILVFIAVLVVIFTIYFAVTYKGNGQIVNNRDGELSAFKDSDFENIETAVKGFLNQYGLTEKEISDAKIVIREGSVKIRKESYDDAEYASFLVDVSNPKLTYEASLMIGGPEEEVFLTCPAVSLMQDPEVFCVGNERESTIDVALGDYLPYNSVEAGESDLGISIWHDYDESDGWPTLKISAGVCDGSDQTKQVEQFVKDWVRRKGGVNPDIIPMSFEYVECDDTVKKVEESDDPDFSWR